MCHMCLCGRHVNTFVWQVSAELPFEFTAGAYLQRINTYLEKQSFCDEKVDWPPVSQLQIKVSPTPGLSCADVCDSHGECATPGLSCADVCDSHGECATPGLSCADVCDSHGECAYIFTGICSFQLHGVFGVIVIHVHVQCTCANGGTCMYVHVRVHVLVKWTNNSR